VFVPLAWARQVRRKPNDAAGEASLFAATWIAAMVVIFSISRSKLPAYIYPVYPASALLVGRLWCEAVESGSVDSLRRYAVAAVAVAIVVGAALLIGPRFLPDPVPGVRTALAAMAVSIIAGTILCLGLLFGRRVTLAFAALCAGSVALVLAAVALGLPIASRTVAEPAVAVASEVRRLAPPGLPVFAYRLAPPQATLPFYARRPVLTERTQEGIRKAVRGVGSVVVIGQEGRVDGLPAGGKLLSRHGRYLIYRFDRR